MNTLSLYKPAGDSRPNTQSVILGSNYRFTILTSRMIRLEYSPIGLFQDKPTQTVIHRNFPAPDFQVNETRDSLEVITKNLYLSYDKKPFSSHGLTIEVNGNLSAYHSKWHFGTKPVTLKGTAKTLDQADGPIDLEEGLLSATGFAIIDDSKSMIIQDNGLPSPHVDGMIDIYFLGYGRDYLACLKDFFTLTGPTPLLPRYTLGNWWSRFHRYTDESYRDLISKFEKNNIPFSVSVIDMDWHLTDINPKYGSGWTGYTWNKELFPDPKSFMHWLHKKGLKITLNVHPADGVRAHEEMYVDMAKELGVDYKNEVKIPFDASNPAFLNAYFKYLHHPQEENGVDFWWIDWQQEGGSKTEGLDPLWILNHYHYMDSGRKGKRPLTFSRYAGFGSHRYPIGFSGDTIVSWESLDFQPYFTATASNAGYGWWSHDIGGHMGGIKNDELATRWLQFGVFSPIMRLHSSSSPFNHKEPWMFNLTSEKIMSDFLRFRHKLVPYLYTMNEICHRLGLPLTQPMYYHNSEMHESYEVPNQYYFGSELIVCPITKPADPNLTMAPFNAWLPNGVYFDIFNGRLYQGNRKITLYRDLYTIPVLAKAGSILPLCSDSSIQNGTDNPEELEVLFFTGADGEFNLYEDNGLTNSNLKSLTTKMSIKHGSTTELTINTPKGDLDVIPLKRKYRFIIYGLSDIRNITVLCNNKKIPFTSNYKEDDNQLIIDLGSMDSFSEYMLVIENSNKLKPNNIVLECFNLLQKAQIRFELKTEILSIIKKHSHTTQLTGELQALHLDDNLFGSLVEIITA